MWGAGFICATLGTRICPHIWGSMAGMTENTVVIHEPALKILDYAARIGVNHRTVREWIRNGLLPDAYQDGRNVWWIPASARRRETPVAPRKEDTAPSAHGTVATLANPRENIVPSFIPLYMPLDDAAPLLGVTPYQLAEHQEEFGVKPWGDNGSLVVPVRHLLGMSPALPPAAIDGGDGV